MCRMVSYNFFSSSVNHMRGSDKQKPCRFTPIRVLKSICVYYEVFLNTTFLLFFQRHYVGVRFGKLIWKTFQKMHG